VAIERKSKLILNFGIGRRGQATTDIFIEGLRAAASKQRFQITTDGFQSRKPAITTTLSNRCNFSQLIKVYAQAPLREQRRNSTPDVTYAERSQPWQIPIPRRFARPMQSAKTS
jgi:hypothetical protein